MFLPKVVRPTTVTRPWSLRAPVTISEAEALPPSTAITIGRRVGSGEIALPRALTVSTLSLLHKWTIADRSGRKAPAVPTAESIYPPGLPRRSSTRPLIGGSVNSRSTSATAPSAVELKTSSLRYPMLPSTTIPLATGMASRAALIVPLRTTSRRTVIDTSSPAANRSRRDTSAQPSSAGNRSPNSRSSSPTMRPALSAGLPAYTSATTGRQVAVTVRQGRPSSTRANATPRPLVPRFSRFVRNRLYCAAVR